ncbi:MAG: TldD/PmbA family protein, partial [Opitutus sp.]|nr:TldD/PmbA family protein [Opitutus sp.]
MPLLSESEAHAILQKVLALSKADECQIDLSGGRAGNVRFARNTVSTSGGSDTLSLRVRSSFGKRTGSAAINEFDAASLEKVVRRAEELARLAPEDPEHMELLGPQSYPKTQGYVESTANLSPAGR